MTVVRYDRMYTATPPVMYIVSLADPPKANFGLAFLQTNGDGDGALLGAHRRGRGTCWLVVSIFEGPLLLGVATRASRRIVRVMQ